MIKRSIRFRLTLVYSLMLIGIVILSFASIYAVNGIVIRRTVREYLVSVVDNNFDAVKYYASDPEFDTDSEKLIAYSGGGSVVVDRDFTNVIDDVYCMLCTGNGQVICSRADLGVDPSSAPFVDGQIGTFKSDGEKYDYYDRKLDIQLPDGGELWIRGVVPQSDNVKLLQNITLKSLVFLPVIAVIAIIAGYFVTAKALSPIRKIERLASDITRGDDLKKRIETGGNPNDEIDRLAGVFNEMFGRLDASFEQEKQFTSDVSHELRTPVSVILAQCEYVLEKERTPEEYREAIRTIGRHSEKMNTLINDMLEYNRMKQGAERYPVEKVNFSALAEEAAAQYSTMNDGGITMTTRIEPGVVIRGNRGLLEMMLHNLIGNAYKYGKRDGHVELVLERRRLEGADRDSAVFEVIDDGVGISAEDQEKIFDRFFRCESSRGVQGSGLGLSMVRTAAEILDAGLSVESEPGKGSIFTVVLKLADGEL